MRHTSPVYLRKGKPPARIDFTYPRFRDVAERVTGGRPLVYLDFETFYDKKLDLGKMTTIEYVEHPNFETTGLVSAVEDEEPVCVVEDTIGNVAAHIRELQNRFGGNLEGCVVVGHNLSFDALVLSRRYGILLDHDRVSSLDTMAIGAAVHPRRNSNSLASWAGDIGSTPKGDTKQFRGLAAGDDSPKLWASMIEYMHTDITLTRRLLKHLLPRWSNPETEAWLQHHTLQLWLRPSLAVDEDWAEDTKLDMAECLHQAVQQTGLTMTEIRGGSFDGHLFEALRRCGDDPDLYTKPAKNVRGWKMAVAKDDPQREWLINHEDPVVRALMEAKAAVGSWPNHMRRIERFLRIAEASDGRLPIPLRYFGAHTGRWSGSERVNLQNLGGRGDPLVAQIRGIIVPPIGHKLVITDFSSIEARVLAWVAGEKHLLQVYREGGDAYCAMAEEIHGQPVRKPTEDDDPEYAAWLRMARQDGKVAVLGGGYGMGAKTMAAQHGIEQDRAQTIVDAYRRANKQIINLWYRLYDGVRMAVSGRPNTVAGMRIQMLERRVLGIQLHSGRWLRYYDPILDDGDVYLASGAMLYGGALTENVVQALARELLVAAFREAERRRPQSVAFHVHDEVVQVARDSEAPAVLEETVGIMSTPPEWAAGLPLAAEGVISDRYGNH